MSGELDDVVNSLNNKISLLEGKYMNFVDYCTKMLESSRQQLGRFDQLAADTTINTSNELTFQIHTERERVKQELSYMRNLKSSFSIDPAPTPKNIQIGEILESAKCKIRDLVGFVTWDESKQRELLKVFGQLNEGIYKLISSDADRTMTSQVAKLQSELKNLQKSKDYYKQLASKYKSIATSDKSPSKFKAQLKEKESLLGALMQQNTSLKRRITLLEKSDLIAEKSAADDAKLIVKTRGMEKQMAELVQLSSQVVGTLENLEIPHNRLLDYEVRKLQEFMDLLPIEFNKSRFSKTQGFANLRSNIFKSPDLTPRPKKNQTNAIDDAIQSTTSLLTNGLKNINEKVSSTDTRLSKLMQCVQKLKLKTLKKSELEYTKIRLRKVTNERNELRSRSASLTESLEASQEELRQVKEHKSSLQQELEQAEQCIAEQINENENIVLQIDELTQANKDKKLSSTCKITTLNSKVDEWKNKTQELESELLGTRKNATTYRSKLTEQQIEYEDNKQQLREARTDYAALQLAFESRLEEVENLREKLSNSSSSKIYTDEEHNALIDQLQAEKESLELKNVESLAQKEIIVKRSAEVKQLQQSMGKLELEISRLTEDNSYLTAKLADVDNRSDGKYRDEISRLMEENSNLYAKLTDAEHMSGAKCQDYKLKLNLANDKVNTIEDQLETQKQKAKSITDQLLTQKQINTDLRGVHAKESERMESKIVELCNSLASSNQAKAINQSLEKRTLKAESGTQKLITDMENLRKQYENEKMSHNITSQQYRDLQVKYDLQLEEAQRIEIDHDNLQHQSDATALELTKSQHQLSRLTTQYVEKSELLQQVTDNLVNLQSQMGSENYEKSEDLVRIQLDLDNVTQQYMKEQQEHKQTQSDLADLLSEYEIQSKTLSRAQSEICSLQEQKTTRPTSPGTVVYHDVSGHEGRNWEFSFDVRSSPIKSDIDNTALSEIVADEMNRLRDKCSRKKLKNYELQGKIQELEAALEVCKPKDETHTQEEYTSLCSEQFDFVHEKYKNWVAEKLGFSECFSMVQIPSTTQISTAKIPDSEVLNDQIKTLQNDVESYRAHTEELEGQVRQLSQQNGRLNYQIDIFRNENEAIKLSKANLEQNMLNIADNKSELKDELRNKTQDLKDLQNQIADLTDALNENKRKATKSQDVTAQHQGEFQMYDLCSIECSNIKTQLAEAQENIQEKDKIIGNLQKKLQFSQQNEEKDKVIRDLQNKLQYAQYNTEKSQSQLTTLQQKLESTQEEAKMAENSKKAAEEHANSLSLDLKQSGTHVHQLMQENQRLSMALSESTPQQNSSSDDSDTVDDALAAFEKQEPAKCNKTAEQELKVGQELSINQEPEPVAKIPSMFDASSIHDISVQSNKTSSATQTSPKSLQSSKINSEILSLREEIFQYQNALTEKTRLAEKYKCKYIDKKSDPKNPLNQSHFKEAFVKFVMSIPGHTRASYDLYVVLARMLQFSGEDISAIETKRASSQHSTGNGLLSIFGL